MIIPALHYILGNIYSTPYLIDYGNCRSGISELLMSLIQHNVVRNKATHLFIQIKGLCISTSNDS